MMLCQKRVYNMKFFVDGLPDITTKLPISNNGNEISISFYIFNSKTSNINPNGKGTSYTRYFKELSYAYKQLVECTNILDCGRIRVFCDTRLHDYASRYFETIGLQDIITWVTVPQGARLSGYIPFLEDETVSECRYRFHTDSDRFWINLIDQEPFDFTLFCNTLDSYCDMHLFGREGTGYVTFDNMLLKHGRFCLDHDLFDNADYNSDENHSREQKVNMYVQRTAEMHFDRIFFGKIPDLYYEIIRGGDKFIEDQPFMTGQFVGTRKDSFAGNLLHREYTRHGGSDTYADDEAFLFTLLYRYPELKICPIFQPRHIAEAGMIRETWINDIEFPNNAHNIDIGAHIFFDPEHEDNRQKLLRYLSR